jgi:CheY-like chemotaxis protein/HPt (histidine-containing phosphotransfer) domain-containing protein
VQPSPPLVPSAAAQKAAHILLVEDAKINQFVATRLMQGLGYSVDVANNGVEAVAACTATEYDVVFMDVMMPEMDGLTATAIIRKLPKPFCGPYIIALTAVSQKEDKDACLRAGMDDFLLKPVTRNALAAKLDAVLAAHASAPPIVPADQHQAAEQVVEPDGSDAPVFDETIYADLADALGHDETPSVLDLFLSDTEQRFTVMRVAAKTSDHDCVKREAHSMKSSAANFGFLRLSALAKALERDALGLGGPTLSARLDALARAFADIKAIAASQLGPPAPATRPGNTAQPEAQGEIHVD